MTMCPLIRPPNRYIWWKYAHNGPPKWIKLFQKLRTAVWLFAAFLFFDNFPLNPLLFDREFKGKLSKHIADLHSQIISRLKFGEISALLSKFVYILPQCRSPPLLRALRIKPAKIQKIVDYNKCIMT